MISAMHQPYREELVPQLSRVIRAGETAGAIGGFLSGSGSAIMCLTSGSEIAVAKAMRKQLPKSEVRIFVVDNAGFKLVAREHKEPIPTRPSRSRDWTPRRGSRGFV